MELPSSIDISLFSRRLFRVGITLRSARSMPLRMRTRPPKAARNGAWAVKQDEEP
jgi:hypothetical protein